MGGNSGRHLPEEEEFQEYIQQHLQRQQQQLQQQQQQIQKQQRQIQQQQQQIQKQHEELQRLRQELDEQSKQIERNKSQQKHQQEELVKQQVLQVQITSATSGGTALSPSGTPVECSTAASGELQEELQEELQLQLRASYEIVLKLQEQEELEQAQHLAERQQMVNELEDVRLHTHVEHQQQQLMTQLQQEQEQARQNSPMMHQREQLLIQLQSEMMEQEKSRLNLQNARYQTPPVASQTPSAPQLSTATRTPITPLSIMTRARGPLIGRGAFGVVYHYTHLHTGESIAVKEVPFNPKKHTAVMDEFVALTQLRHPNVISVRGFEQSKDMAYIIMEFMPRGSLKSGQQFPERLIRHYVRQALEGLAYLHSQGIVHRDIKPRNMLLSGDGTLKLADFGECKSLVDASRSTHNFHGTPVYSSPEALRPQGPTYIVSFASDVWSLGASMVEMATGQLPWSELGIMDPYQLVFHIGSGAGDNHHPRIPSHLSAEAQDFLKQTFRLDPQQRPSASQLLHHPFVSPNLTEYHQLQEQLQQLKKQHEEQQRQLQALVEKDRKVQQNQQQEELVKQQPLLERIRKRLKDQERDQEKRRQQLEELQRKQDDLHCRLQDLLQLQKLPTLYDRGPKIGEGGNGVVYLIRAIATGEHLVMKETIVSDGVAVSDVDATREALRKEYEVLSKLQHPNVVGVHEFLVHEDRAYLFMEWMHGGSVDSMLPFLKKPVPETLLRHLSRHALIGLAHVHSHNIVHGDIKPANMLLTLDGTLKLGDFGSCRTLTDFGTLDGAIGTHMYASPELAQSFLNPNHATAQHRTFAMDVWALGASIVEMASGELPWSELSNDEVDTTEPRLLLFRIAYPPDGESHHPRIPAHLSPEAQDFLKQTFRVDPEQRPSALQLLQHPFVSEAGCRNAMECVQDYMTRRRDETSHMVEELSNFTSEL